MLPVVVEEVTDLQGDFTRVANGVDVENVQYNTNQCSLGTTSIETLRRGAALPEAQYHLPVVQVAQDQPEEPLGDLQS